MKDTKINATIAIVTLIAAVLNVRRAQFRHRQMVVRQDRL